MKRHTYPGKFIVFEGIDGSGKFTQAKLLASFLRKRGKRVRVINFPQYGKKSAGPLEEYLNGKYGNSKEVGPYRASIFFACDRYDAAFKLVRWLQQGAVVISDRYVASNIAHQGGKLSGTREYGSFVRWLYHLEYDIFGIPKPNLNFILKTSPEFSFQLAHRIDDKKKLKARKAYLGDKKRDIHERDREHLQDALACYLEVAKKFPRDFKLVECIEEGKLLPPDVIHKRIVKIVSTIL